MLQQQTWKHFAK